MRGWRISINELCDAESVERGKKRKEGALASLRMPSEEPTAGSWRVREGGQGDRGMLWRMVDAHHFQRLGPCQPVFCQLRSGLFGTTAVDTVAACH